MWGSARRICSASSSDLGRPAVVWESHRDIKLQEVAVACYLLLHRGLRPGISRVPDNEPGDDALTIKPAASGMHPETVACSCLCNILPLHLLQAIKPCCAMSSVTGE